MSQTAKYSRDEVVRGIVMTQSNDNPLYEIIIWFWDKITALTFADLLNLPTKYSTHDTILP